MKKLTALSLALFLLLGLCACGGAKLDPSSTEGQLKLLADNKDVWFHSDAEHLYTVTDLDENGRLEMIASLVEGSGQFSYSYFYEVSSDYKSVEPVEYTYGQEHSEPDLGGLARIRCYRVPGDNVYIVNDVIRINADEVYDVQDYICLKNGAVNVEDLAWCMMLSPGYTCRSDNRTEVYYYSGGDGSETLDAGGYINYCDGFFEPYERLVCTLGWIQLAGETGDALSGKLADSWKGFKLEPDDLIFDNLKYDPASYLPSEQKIVMGFEPEYGMDYLEGNWDLLMLEDQGGNFMPKDVFGADAGLTFIGKVGEGQVYFHYGNPVDPRGSYLLTEMRYQQADGLGLDEDPNWTVEFFTDDGLERFNASIDSETGFLIVTWFEWQADAPGADPMYMTMVFEKTQGVG
ncbi:MAG: hypothetical protein IJM08_05890 [Firmicutes bacterium]|nr:hypothetical protein [Bacillota bacterium]